MGWLNDVLDWMLAAVEGVEPWLRILIASIAMALETSVLIGLIVPGDTVVIVSGMGVTSVPEGVVLATCVVVGALLGETFGFFLGRWVGPHLRASRLGRWIGEKNWVRAETYFQRRGGIAIFLSRFLPVMHSLVPLTVGMSGYSYRKFLAWTTPACILWSTIYISVSAGAAGTYRELGDHVGSNVHWIGYVFVGVIVLFLFLVWLVKRLLQRAERRHMESVAVDSVDQAGPTEDENA